MRFVTDFHRNGKLTKGLNSTFIALIQKVDSPQRLNDFRPISLVGSLYKILAKVLAYRLRMVIGSVISESQTAFVKDMQILDGILIANEAVDEARRNKKELMLFKVDFEKPYDSVDWGYLDAVMGKMSFPILWKKWIKECIGTASASVLVNGSPADEFPLERGFGVQNQNFVSHLQFADDTLLLGTKSWANVRALRAALVLFETISGLKVNFNKSMLVGVNIVDSWLSAAATTLRCKVGKVPFLYLGLPIGGDPTRLGFWELVLTRIQNRLSGWKSRFLSFGGRIVAEFSSLGWGTGGGVWVWRRQLWAWEEEMLGECQNLLHDYLLQAQTPDVWIWRPDPIRGYSVQGAYYLLTSHPLDPLDGADNLIWHRQVPLKVSIFAWRLLPDRLPTRMNLANRGIITPDAQLYVAGCGEMESTQHLFLACCTFGSLWSMVRAWLGITSVDPIILTDHFLQFTWSSGGLRARRSF
ncbi:hypothetical protein TSUD_406040 [Trifolium subterraneum]|uniref:Reverse transcriptase domain-containing protein n=1 Tax=Trifolium subterraneum TaxID=3900 RepID=A0A2Z6PG54_TRISU|nr:hypothetical protein TSUD_406040 [Trifolium subterraneum]